MADYTKYFQKPVAGLLGREEEFLAGTPCLPRGQITKRLLGAAAFSATSSSAASKRPRGVQPPYVGQDLPSTLAVGVTQERLMVFGLHVASGRPNRVLYDIPISEIARIDSCTGRSVGMKKLEVDIVLSNGAALNLDVAREHVRKGTVFVECATNAMNLATTKNGNGNSVSGETSRPQPSAVPSVATTSRGWYPVEGQHTVQRFWDGMRWTHQVHWDGQSWRQII